MSDKTEFARVVPAMIQEKAADWLLSKLDEELDDLKLCVMDGGHAPAIPTLLKAAEFRGKLIHETFIAQYADSVENVEITVGPINIEKTGL